MNRFFLLILLTSFTKLVIAQTNYTEITLPELMKKKVKGQDMIIVDVRSAGEYGDTGRGKSGNIGRIRGAININVTDLQNDPNAVHKLDAYKDKEVYLICSHSYRSRAASRVLLNNGFAHVNNVRGGMTEWYRRYDELKDYRDQLDDHEVVYKNLSPAELMNDLENGKLPLLVGIRNNPRFWWDSANVRFYNNFPQFRGAVYYDYADSLKLLAEAEKNKSRQVVLYNIVNNGAAELAEWLKLKGYNAAYLIGGLNLFFEYAANQMNPAKTDRYFTWQNDMRILTPSLYCRMSNDKDFRQNFILIDNRHDTLFNKINSGVKHDYMHIKNASNFYFGLGADEFEKRFSDKGKQYVFINEFGSAGMEMAAALTRKGYKISWLLGGYDRWEWYMNNVEDFKCTDWLE
jgi:rhodanese-related sulfurtransferase